MTVPDGMIPGFPGGTSSRQELLSRSGTSERISLVRTGTYWGTERRQEDVLTRTRDGWTLIERIDHYRSQSDGTWKQDRCSAESEGPFIAIRRPVGDRWAVTLRCTATHIIQQFEFEVIDETTKTYAGKQHDVLVVRSTMTQAYDPPQPFRSGTVARTEWISASLEIPIEWTKESRGAAGEQGPSDRARLMPPG